MQDLLTSTEPQPIDLPDADLLLWQDVDLGRPGHAWLERLIDSVPWRQDKITLFGKTHPQPRLSAWYGDMAYRYSGLTLQPLAWTPDLLELKYRVENLTGQSFNSVLLNYYRDQNDSMGMHSDDEKELGPRPMIASLSLGDERLFSLKHRTRRDLKTLRLPLADRSLLLMRGDTQQHWRHGIGKSGRHSGARINLTFRRIYGQEYSETT
jgi:alkylated DNA repair dioxygenase AlkB